MLLENVTQGKEENPAQHNEHNIVRNHRLLQFSIGRLKGKETAQKAVR